MSEYWLPGLMLVLGMLHAAAAYFYFSKEGRAWPWSAAWLVFTGLCIALLGAAPHGALLLFLAAILGWTLWWDSIRAQVALGWVVENARQATAEIVDEDLIVRNLRNFEWLGGRDCVPRWEVRRYPLGQLAAIDLFVCSWGYFFCGLPISSSALCSPTCRRWRSPSKPAVSCASAGRCWRAS